MEIILFGVAIFFFVTIVKASTTSQKDIDEHNTKVSLERTLDDAYKNSNSPRLNNDLKDLENRYKEIVDKGVKKYISQHPDTSNRNGAIFLGFDRVFSVEEFLVITKYEAILKALNEKLPARERKISEYQSATRYLESMYNIDS